MSKLITTTDDPEPGIMVYRAYRTNRSGAFASVEFIAALSDDEAKVKVAKMTNGHGIDLWERERFLASLPPLSAIEGG